MTSRPSNGSVQNKRTTVGTSQYAPPRMKDYVLTEKLGSGTYATVYKGYRKVTLENSSREIVAVKCITKKSLSKSSVENLLREIEILKGLDHEHIVKLKDFDWDQDNIYLILEYCSGGDLSKYIQRYKRLPEHVARRFLRQLALALRYIREKNISHMDLKPQNLLIQSKENLVLKVGDFGFAQYLLGKEGRDNLRGSPLYMAVEMFLSDSYDASVDLWSTGVILYETLYGNAPFASKTYEELEIKILATSEVRIPSQPAISSECYDLLRRLLQRDPKQRITFEQFFSHKFLDLEHAPSSDILTKAIQRVTEAIDFDTKGLSDLAVESYCKALEFFLPAIEYESNQDKKAALRSKVKQYIDRAELLKRNEKIKKRENRAPQTITLKDCAAELPGLADALKHAELGEELDDARKYDDAMTEYQRASEICMSILSSIEKDSSTALLIRQKAKDLLIRMEELTRYKKLTTQEGNQAYQCCVQ